MNSICNAIETQSVNLLAILVCLCEYDFDGMKKLSINYQT